MFGLRSIESSLTALEYLHITQLRNKIVLSTQIHSLTKITDILIYCENIWQLGSEHSHITLYRNILHACESEFSSGRSHGK